jgi:hypothetical protein
LTLLPYTPSPRRLTDIVAGRAPMQRQGFLAVPQRVVNAIGWWGASALAALLGAGVLYVV